jgi:hypothetical protein
MTEVRKCFTKYPILNEYEKNIDKTNKQTNKLIRLICEVKVGDPGVCPKQFPNRYRPYLLQPVTTQILHGEKQKQMRHVKNLFIH